MERKLPPGVYYIGDLCYVMTDEWDEFCDNLDHDEEVCQLKSGKKYMWASTSHGDGTYTDQYGNEYPVDAGLIGAILLRDIDQTNLDNNTSLGTVVVISEPFTVYREDDVIYAGPFAIDTGYED